LLIAEVVKPNSDPIFSGGLSSVLSVDLNKTDLESIKYSLPNVFDSNPDDILTVYVNGKLPSFVTL